MSISVCKIAVNKTQFDVLSGQMFMYVPKESSESWVLRKLAAAAAGCQQTEQLHTGEDVRDIRLPELPHPAQQAGDPGAAAGRAAGAACLVFHCAALLYSGWSTAATTRPGLGWTAPGPARTSSSSRRRARGVGQTARWTKEPLPTNEIFFCMQVAALQAELVRREPELQLEDVLNCHVGVAHTRWATHGVPNQVKPTLTFGLQMNFGSRARSEQYISVR